MQLAHESFIAALGERSIVLDLRRDRYFGLGARLTKLALATASATRSDLRSFGELQPLLDTLAAEGVIPEARAAENENSTPNDTPPPSVTIWPTDRFGVGLDKAPGYSISALWALSLVKLSLERRSFVDTIGWLRRRHLAAHSRTPMATVSDLIDAYYAARPWFPIKPICRLDAPALCIHLWSHGHDPKLVFGVRGDPFMAHCWAQFGESSISEPADRLHQFTPIMSV